MLGITGQSEHNDRELRSTQKMLRQSLQRGDRLNEYIESYRYPSTRKKFPFL
jgi:hypothetical protein